MKRLLFLTLVLSVTLNSRAAEFAVSLPPDGLGGFRMRWDSVHDRLIAYRDNSQLGAAAVLLFNADGSVVTPIYPLRDLKDLQGISIWGATSTNDGGLVIAAILDYGNHQVKSVLLTYDALGRLLKVWDVDPAHQHAVATDLNGNIFAFGERHEPRSNDYPLLVKYSTQARVLAEFLLANTFEQGDEVVTTNPETGEHHMFVHGDTLFIFIAPLKELFRFSLGGELLARQSLRAMLDTISRQTASSRAEIISLGGLSDGNFIAQLRLISLDGRSGRLELVRFSPDASTWTFDKRVTPQDSPTRLLGTTSSGLPVFLHIADGGNAVLRY